MENLIAALLSNWDVVGLIITNLIALFIDPKKIGIKKDG
jgi:hypothetical protein